MFTDSQSPKYKNELDKINESLALTNTSLIKIVNSVCDYVSNKDNEDKSIKVKLEEDILNPLNDKTVFGEINSTTKSILVQSAINNEELSDSILKLSEIISSTLLNETKKITKNSNKVKNSPKSQSKTLKDNVINNATRNNQTSSSKINNSLDNINNKAKVQKSEPKKESVSKITQKQVFGTHISSITVFKTAVTQSIKNALKDFTKTQDKNNLVLIQNSIKDDQNLTKKRTPSLGSTVLNEVETSKQTPKLTGNKGGSQGNSAEMKMRSSEKLTSSVSSGLKMGMKSLKGMFSGILIKSYITLISLIAGLLAVALLPYMKDIINGLKPIVKSLGEVIKVLYGVVKTIVQSLVPVFKALSPVVEKILKVFVATFKVVGKILSFGISKIIGPTLTVIAKVLNVVLGVVIGIFKVVGGIIKGIVKVVSVPLKIIGGILRGIFKVVGGIIKGIATVISVPFKIIGGILRGISKVVGGIIKGIATVISVPLKIISGILSGISKVVGGLVKGIAFVITAPFKGLFAGVKKTLQIFSKPIDKISSLFEVITKPIVGIFDFIKKIFGGVVKIGAGIIAITSLLNFKKVGEFFKNSFTKMKSFFVGGAKKTTDNIKQNISSNIETAKKVKNKAIDYASQLKAYKDRKIKELEVDKYVHRAKNALLVAQSKAVKAFSLISDSESRKGLINETKNWLAQKRMILGNVASRKWASLQIMAMNAKESLSNMAKLAKDKVVASGQKAIDLAMIASRKVRSAFLLRSDTKESLSNMAKLAKDKVVAVGQKALDLAMMASRKVRSAFLLRSDTKESLSNVAKLAKDKAISVGQKAIDLAMIASRKIRSVTHLTSNAQEIASDSAKLIKDKAMSAGQKALDLAMIASRKVRSVAHLTSNAQEIASDVAKFAKDKVRALGDIAMNLGRAVAKAVRSVAGLPFPANLIAGAAAITGVIALGAAAYKMMGASGKSASASAGGGSVNKKEKKSNKENAKLKKEQKRQQKEEEKKRKEEEKQRKREEKEKRIANVKSKVKAGIKSATSLGLRVGKVGLASLFGPMGLGVLGASALLKRMSKKVKSSSKDKTAKQAKVDSQKNVSSKPKADVKKAQTPSFKSKVKDGIKSATSLGLKVGKNVAKVGLASRFGLMGLGVLGASALLKRMSKKVKSSSKDKAVKQIKTDTQKKVSSKPKTDIKSRVKDGFKKLATSAKTKVLGAKDAIKDKLSNNISRIKSGMSSNISRLLKFGIAIIKKGSTILKKSASQVKSFFSKTPLGRLISKKMSSKPKGDVASSKPKTDIKSRVKDGFKKLATSAKTKVLGVKDVIKDKLSNNISRIKSGISSNISRFLKFGKETAKVGSTILKNSTSQAKSFFSKTPLGMLISKKMSSMPKDDDADDDVDSSKQKNSKSPSLSKSTTFDDKKKPSLTLNTHSSTRDFNKITQEVKKTREASEKLHDEVSNTHFPNISKNLNDIQSTLSAILSIIPSLAPIPQDAGSNDAVDLTGSELASYRNHYLKQYSNTNYFKT